MVICSFPLMMCNIMSRQSRVLMHRHRPIAVYRCWWCSRRWLASIRLISRLNSLKGSRYDWRCTKIRLRNRLSLICTLSADRWRCHLQPFHPFPLSFPLTITFRCLRRFYIIISAVEMIIVTSISYHSNDQYQHPHVIHIFNPINLFIIRLVIHL